MGQPVVAFYANTVEKTVQINGRPLTLSQKYTPTLKTMEGFLSICQYL